MIFSLESEVVHHWQQTLRTMIQSIQAVCLNRSVPTPKPRESHTDPCNESQRTPLAGRDLVTQLLDQLELLEVIDGYRGFDTA
jgi:hypothetical protein